MTNWLGKKFLSLTFFSGWCSRHSFTVCCRYSGFFFSLEMIDFFLVSLPFWPSSTGICLSVDASMSFSWMCYIILISSLHFFFHFWKIYLNYMENSFSILSLFKIKPPGMLMFVDSSWLIIFIICIFCHFLS